MKTSLAVLSLAALFTGFSADTAEAAKVKHKHVTKTVHRDAFGHKVVQKNKFVKVKKSGYGHGHGHGYGYGGAAPVYGYGRGFRAGFSYGTPVVTPIVVAPSYYYIYKQVWVPAVTNQVVVGYTACGSAVYNTVVVAPACYKTARYRVCSTGPQVFVGYVN